MLLWTKELQLGIINLVWSSFLSADSFSFAIQGGLREMKTTQWSYLGFGRSGPSALVPLRNINSDESRTFLLESLPPVTQIPSKTYGWAEPSWCNHLAQVSPLIVIGKAVACWGTIWIIKNSTANTHSGSN